MPRREVDEIERALAEARDVDPVAPLRREDLDAEILVVHLHAPVTAGGHPLDVGDHPPLEDSAWRSGSLPARRPRGPERRVVDAGTALHGPRAAPSIGQLARHARDLLGVDGVLLDPGPRAGLVIA